MLFRLTNVFSSASQVCLAWLAGSHIVHSRGEKIFERQKYIICFYHSEIKFISLSRRVMFFFYYIDKNYRSESKAHTFNRYKALAARRLEFLKYLPFDIHVRFKKIILSGERFYVSFSELNFSITRRVSTGVCQRLAAEQYNGA